MDGAELVRGGGWGPGYLLKDRVFDDAGFVRSVKAVAAGGVVVDPETLKELMEHRAVQQRLERLTSRELEVLTLLAGGPAERRRPWTLCSWVLRIPGIDDKGLPCETSPNVPTVCSGEGKAAP